MQLTATYSAACRLQAQTNFRSWEKFFVIVTGKMSDLAWAVKNGDMDQVRELVDNKVD